MPCRDAAHQKTLHVVVERIARSKCEHRFELDFCAELHVADTGPLELVRLATQKNAGRRVSTPAQARAGLAGPRRPDQLLKFGPDQLLSHGAHRALDRADERVPNGGLRREGNRIARGRRSLSVGTAATGVTGGGLEERIALHRGVISRGKGR